MIRRGFCRSLTAFSVLCALACGLRAQSQADSKIALTVNGEAITTDEFYARLQRLSARDFIASINPVRFVNETSGQLVMNSLINERLFLQWAAKTNQMPTDAEILAEVEGLKKQPAIAQLLSIGLLTEDALKFDVRVQRARFNIATTAASVSPKDVETYYKAHLTDYTTPERWGLAALRTSKPDAVAKIEADLKAQKSFSDVVKTYSEDARTRNSGGVLGTVASNDTGLPAPIRDAVKTLKLGEVSPPIRIDVETSPGKKTAIWWFIRLTSKDPPSVRPFEEVKTQVERLALLEQAGGIQVADKKIADYRKQANITINLPGYQNLLPPPKPKP